MKKNFIFTTVKVSVFLSIIVFISLFIKSIVFPSNSPIRVSDVSAKAVDSKIMVDGMVRSQKEASLHFMTGGKLVYLPYKEGSAVKQGSTIASLDTFTVQKQLEAAVNTYNNAQNTYDQTSQDASDKVLRKKLILPYDYYSIAKMDKDDRDEAIQEAIKRLVDQSKNNASNAKIQVELARYAFTFSSIVAPFNGVIVHEDVDTPNVVVTPQTSFTIMDPNALIFRANVAEDQISYISEGSKAIIKINGDANRTYEGNVIKIYPDKVSLPNGNNVYQVDIASQELSKTAVYKQGGIALINNVYENKVILVPSWLILNGHSVWIDNNGKAELKEVKTANTVGAYTEISEGLSEDDKLITDPKSIISDKYRVL